MQRLWLVSLFAVIGFNLSGQTPLLYQSEKGAALLDTSGNLLGNAWAGGLQNPQFSNIDLNNDGIQDLFVFDRSDQTVLTYINGGSGSFRYAPEYEVYFPVMRHWAILTDYNADGKPDIFTYSSAGGGLDIYRNVSQGAKIEFKLEVRELYYHEPSYDLNLYISSADVPAFCDLDNDGDIDILSFDIGGSLLQHFRNNSMELYGVPDSLDFSIVDRCWGKFSESPLDNTIVIGKGCGSVKKRKKHSGSTLLAFDADGDGDKDLLMGDVSFNYLTFLENGRIRTGMPDWPRDTVVAYNNNYPSQSSKVSLYPGAFLADVNNDGLKDLIISPMATGESLNRKQILLYHNTGTATTPQFSFVKNSFLQESMFTGGAFSAPAFWDFNNDGLQDMAVAVQGNAGAGYHYSRIELYQNKGSAKSPFFELVDNDFGGLAKLQLSRLAPAFGDLNGDSKRDMVVGTEFGEVRYYTHTGSTNGIPQMTHITDTFLGEAWRMNIAPNIYDINKDGLNDMIVGSQSGTFLYYKNTGTASSPVMSLEADSFGKVFTNQTFYEYEYDTQGNAIDSSLYIVHYGFSSPYITDLNHNGKFDMVSGSYTGDLFVYLDIENNLSGTFTNTPSILQNKLTGDTMRKDFGGLLIPASADLDGDGLPEIVMGNSRGGLLFLGSNPIITSALADMPPGLSLFPNPAQASITLKTLGFDLNGAWINILDMTGRVVMRLSGTSDRTQQVIDISNLSNGFYLVNVNCTDGKFYSEKLIIR